jgi:hypothetical protein
LDLGVIQDTQLAWIRESNTGMVEYRSISYNSDVEFLESEWEPMTASHTFLGEWNMGRKCGTLNIM